MKLQEYKCKNCGQRFTAEWVDGTTPELFPDCPSDDCWYMNQVEGYHVVKSYRVTTRKPMPEHYNPATGTYESSERAIAEKLKVASEQASARTGVTHNYVPVDLRDKDALGVTEEGLDATYKRRRDSGETDAKTVYITD